MNTSYYIKSPWDSQWIVANDDIVRHITSTNMKPTNIYYNHNIYNFEFSGNKYVILQALPCYVSTINRLTTFYYIVEVKINNTYVLAREHQRNALIKYVMTENPNICVPHTDGGDFKAVFKTVDSNNFKYTTENGNIVEIRRTVVL
jgi:hypothetical protein